jgi:hypothetical protein
MLTQWTNKLTLPLSLLALVLTGLVHCSFPILTQCLALLPVVFMPLGFLTVAQVRVEAFISLSLAHRCSDTCRGFHITQPRYTAPKPIYVSEPLRIATSGAVDGPHLLAYSCCAREPTLYRGAVALAFLGRPGRCSMMLTGVPPTHTRLGRGGEMLPLTPAGPRVTYRLAPTCPRPRRTQAT